MIVPRRRVIPCEAVLVRNFACDTWKPQRLMVYFCVLEKDHLHFNSRKKPQTARQLLRCLLVFNMRTTNLCHGLPIFVASVLVHTHPETGRQIRGLKTLPGGGTPVCSSVLWMKFKVKDGWLGCLETIPASESSFSNNRTSMPTWQGSTPCMWPVLFGLA